jgi:hypothetical protein
MFKIKKIFKDIKHLDINLIMRWTNIIHKDKEKRYSI